ncbi:uncharacterized protein KNAG_0E03340 [Huiozyma naganishii CBS 8797]|uniref:Transcription activator GCR1-like domain-containing protein n=1 Tax=Huiozyma naganishii (strain ATCC MYA-139 / BCRC 22969 / CBS 8797 / KCTC 17520 / NBRC 10181 / NCYC 3082 / Yp74L-3) TaxID=1071383 RepID=J7RZF9_HUIN7|nr:hypothetical protein KNAG_0E03340 [Kazachstania naganishii CBS 8797]CCK70592.1 hypothetical protein KNAG_0E03340 [Kazachstania naganishii CBS 8797]
MNLDVANETTAYSLEDTNEIAQKYTPLFDGFNADQYYSTDFIAKSGNITPDEGFDFSRNEEVYYTHLLTYRNEADRFDFLDPAYQDDVQNSSENYQSILSDLSDMKSEFIRLIDRVDDILVRPVDSYQPEGPIEDNNSYPLTSNFLTVLNNLLDTDTQHRDSPAERDAARVYASHATVNGTTLQQSAPVTPESAVSRSPSLVDEEPCSKLNNCGVILIKWPESIDQLWDEYAKVPSEWSQEFLMTFLMNCNKLKEAGEIELDMKLIQRRKMSIRQLEAKFGSSWRNKDKNFSRQINRRKKIWMAIEEGLSDGLTLRECISTLETYTECMGKSLSSFYRGVPFRIKDMKINFEKNGTS